MDSENIDYIFLICELAKRLGCYTTTLRTAVTLKHLFMALIPLEDISRLFNSFLKPEMIAHPDLVNLCHKK